MSHRIHVHTPIVYDPDIVARALDEPALPVDVSDRVLAPFITIDGRINVTTSNFLRHHTLGTPNLATARRLASDLAGWLDHLCNTCALNSHLVGSDPVLEATEEHFASYYRRRQYGTNGELLSSEGWGRAASAIKRLYEYLQRRLHHPPPFAIVSFSHPQGGRGTTIARYRPRRRNTGSAGTPLTPAFAEHLLAGALRVDLDGAQDAYKGAERDHAVISLGFAAGLRRNNLANVTTYEIPPVGSLPITTMRVADHITKGDAGGDALVFSHRLQAVHHYITGSRAEIAERSTYRPDDPLRVVDADSARVRYADSDGEISTQRWANLDGATRRRLVSPDGASPVLFLNEYTGHPLAYSSFQHVVAKAASFVRERIDGTFPDALRLHDLRHTYAVHLTAAIYRGVIADAVEPHRRDDWLVDHIAAAVELVKFSLGHASEASTRLYIQTAHRFVGIPVDQFLGDH